MKHLQGFGDFASLNESGRSSNTTALLRGDIPGAPIGNVRDLISAIKGIKDRPILIFAPLGVGIAAALKSGLQTIGHVTQLDGSTLGPEDLKLPRVVNGKAIDVETVLVQKMRDSDYILVDDMDQINAATLQKLIKIADNREVAQMIFTTSSVNVNRAFIDALKDRLFVLYYMPEK
jgi:hypothetical protein